MIRIEKEFVHKHKEENVFVFNMRRKIPKKIQKNIMEEFILKNIEKKDKEHLKKEFVEKNLSFIFSNDNICSLNNHIYYTHYTQAKKKFETIFENNVFESIINKEKDFLLSFFKLDGDNYLFYEAPYRIDEEIYKSLIKRLEKEDADYLNKFYIPHPETEEYIITEHISEIEEQKIIEIVKDHNICIDDHDRAHLSDLIDTYPDLIRDYDFFANLKVDTQHNFFFEHPLEHVPGMLVIEGVRQFLMACGHKYGHTPLSGVSLILQDLNVNFTQLLELYSPILVRSIGKEVKYNKHGYWSLYNTDVEIYQNNTLKGIISVKAVSVATKLFKRFRQKSFDQESNSRFLPRAEFSAPFILNDGNHQTLCNINDISFSGFSAHVKPEEEIELYSVSNFYTYLEHVGPIQGMCECVRKECNDKAQNHIAGFKITEISEENKINISEAIKRYCVVNKERNLFDQKKAYSLQKAIP
ncbi:MAG: PilZ domain-containing protein [Spirochaetales bacterium]|nr:PilZ domain-containing protein [Spirochaetales bacterium]